jgi:outer membrane lipoprotein-sorting protein
MTAAIVMAVGWLVGMLVVACVAQAKENREASDELNEHIHQLQQVASSVTQTSEWSARLLRSRAQPFRRILQGVPEVGGQPQGH